MTFLLLVVHNSHYLVVSLHSGIKLAHVRVTSCLPLSVMEHIIANAAWTTCTALAEYTASLHCSPCTWSQAHEYTSIKFIKWKFYKMIHHLTSQVDSIMKKEKLRTIHITNCSMPPQGASL